jgi:Rrf2 family protein
MKVSAKAEYACFALMELAITYAEAQPVSVKTIADAHGIPQNFLVQILLQLKRAGLVASVRGASGGYQLAKAPTEISLAEIIDAFDPPPAPPTHVGATTSPVVQTIHAVWKDLEAREQRMQAEERRLQEQLTLAELVRRTQENGSLSYQI